MWGFEFSLDFEPSKIYNLRCICHGHAQVLTENNSTKWSKKKIKVTSNIPWLPIVLFSDGKFHGFLDTRNWKDHRSGALETKINSVFTNKEFPHIPGENKSETEVTKVEILTSSTKRSRFAKGPAVAPRPPFFKISCLRRNGHQGVLQEGRKRR